MVTLNPATCFGLEHRLGGIAPGRDADILVLGDLHDPTPELVVSKGKIVSEKGTLLSPFPVVNWKRFSRAPEREYTVRATKNLFEIPSSSTLPIAEGNFRHTCRKF
jgi:adenine deaminase